jgi:hypothetical protein
MTYPAHKQRLDKLIVLHLALYVLGLEFGRSRILIS